MNKTTFLLALGLAFFAARAHAQPPRANRRAAEPKPPVEDVRPPVEDISSLAQMTPEMWFYQQENRRYDDPKMAVRRKAEYKALQRQRRIAAMQWYGFSNSRPSASGILFSGSYSPGWGSNYRSDPYLWRGPRGGTYYNAQLTNANYGLW